MVGFWRTTAKNSGGRVIKYGFVYMSAISFIRSSDSELLILKINFGTTVRTSSLSALGCDTVSGNIIDGGGVDGGGVTDGRVSGCDCGSGGGGDDGGGGREDCTGFAC